MKFTTIRSENIELRPLEKQDLSELQKLALHPDSWTFNPTLKIPQEFVSKWVLTAIGVKKEHSRYP